MNVVFLMTIIILLSVYMISMKKIPAGSFRLTVFVTAAYTGMVFIAYFIIALVTKDTVSKLTVGWGIICAIFNIITVLCYFLAIQTGPLSHTSFLISASMVIPVVGSAVIWNETITTLQTTGVILFLLAFYFVGMSGVKENKQVRKGWIVLCLTAFFSNGFISLVMKAQQIATQGKESSSFMAVFSGSTCLFGIIILCIMAIFHVEPVLSNETRTKMKKIYRPLFCIAFSNGAANALIIYLSSRVSGAWLYPCIQGGNVILVALFSACVLKEKINKRGWLGIAIGIIAMVILSV